jgi:hypothetical protein
MLKSKILDQNLKQEQRQRTEIELGKHKKDLGFWSYIVVVVVFID